MRAMFFLFSFICFLGAFLWVTLSGASFVVALVGFVFFCVVLIGYADLAVLYLFGAREVRGSDEAAFFAAVAQEAYKLSLPMPKLYFYNGVLERGFVLQCGGRTSIVLSKALLAMLQPHELSAACFELLLQVKKEMSSKRTRVMLLVGVQSWVAHGTLALLMVLVPNQEIRHSMNCYLNYLLSPWLNFMFKLSMGEKYFIKLGEFREEFISEAEHVKRMGLKLRRPEQVYSLTSRRLIELSTSSRSHSFQNILILEFLPHEWDFLFNQLEVSRASKI